MKWKVVSFFLSVVLHLVVILCFLVSWPVSPPPFVVHVVSSAPAPQPKRQPVAKPVTQPEHHAVVPPPPARHESHPDVPPPPPHHSPVLMVPVHKHPSPVHHEHSHEEKNTHPHSMKHKEMRHEHEQWSPTFQSILQEDRLKSEPEVQSPRHLPPHLSQTERPMQGTDLDPNYANDIRSHIYQFAVMPLNIDHASFVRFQITQDSFGHVKSIEKQHSSGVKAYDEAVYRAIQLASPLPLPKDPRQFQSVIVLTFYPGDNAL